MRHAVLNFMDVAKWLVNNRFYYKPVSLGLGSIINGPCKYAGKFSKIGWPTEVLAAFLLSIAPEINRDWTQIGGARETQWTTVAVLRACSELRFFARFL